MYCTLSGSINKLCKGIVHQNEYVKDKYMKQ